jgi:CHAT domain-containing protein/tetratricopeptide (TPR) repeat protein
LLTKILFIGIIFFQLASAQSVSRQNAEQEKAEIDRLLQTIFANKQDDDLLTNETPITKQVIHSFILEADRTIVLARKLAILRFIRDAARNLGERELEASILRRMGKTLLNFGQKDQARAVWKEARELFKQANDPKELILLFTESADLEQYFSDYQAARRFASESLRLAESVPLSDRPVELKFAIALSEEILGICDKWDGRYESSLKFLNQALNEYLVLQQAHPSAPRRIVQTILDIGRVHRTLGEYQTALEIYDRAIVLNGGKDKSLDGDIFNSIGILYDEQRNYVKAQSYYRRSLAIFEAAGARSKLSSVKLNIGIGYLMQDQPDVAIDWYRKSLADAEATKYKDDILAARKSIAGALLKKGDFSNALRQLDESEALAVELDDKVQLAEIRYRRAEAYYGRQDHHQAIDSARTALGLATQMSLPNLTWLSQTIIGKSQLALGDLNQSEEAFSLAIAGIEKSRTDVAGTNLDRQFFFEDKVDPYHGMIRTMVARGRIEEALLYSERVRGRVLHEIKQQPRVKPEQYLTPEEREKEKRLRDELVALSTQDLHERMNPAGPRDSTSGDKLREARLAFESFQAYMTARHPELRFRRDEISQISLKSISSILPGERSAFLSYILTKEQVLLFILKRDGAAAGGSHLSAHILPSSPESLNKSAMLFARRIAGRSIEFKALARQMYDLLFAPAELDLKGVDRLYIVPDGQLWKVPYQALISQDDRYLLERFTISYTPSLSQIAGANGRDQKAKYSGVLAVGNPLLTGSGLSPLPESEQEIRAIAKSYNADQSRIFTGKKATIDRVRNAMPDFRILHFATHGLLDDVEPMYSALTLADRSSDAGEVSFLEAWEVAQSELYADLAVLSACDTAGGKVRRGEGLIGMAWAFLAAGVRTVVVGQWAVDSKSTVNLMAAFHQELNRNSRGFETRDSAAALRKTALLTMREAGTEHPFFWASFSVFGQGN